MNKIAIIGLAVVSVTSIVMRSVQMRSVHELQKRADKARQPEKEIAQIRSEIAASVADTPFYIRIELTDRDSEKLRALKAESIKRMQAWREAEHTLTDAERKVARRYNLEYTATTTCAIFREPPFPGGHPACAWYDFPDADDYSAIQATWQNPPYRRTQP